MHDAPRTKPLAGSAHSTARARQAQRPAGRMAPQAPPDLQTKPLTDVLADPAAVQKAQPALQMQEPVATAGRNGEHNLSLQWVDVWIGNTKPCRFDVTTLPGHALEVVVEQAAYRRVYAGTGSVSTQPVPVAPLGTPLSATATDTVTGETIQQAGVWRDMSGGRSLWDFIKCLVWKG